MFRNSSIIFNSFSIRTIRSIRFDLDPIFINTIRELSMTLLKHLTRNTRRKQFGIGYFLEAFQLECNEMLRRCFPVMIISTAIVQENLLQTLEDHFFKENNRLCERHKFSPSLSQSNSRNFS